MREKKNHYQDGFDPLCTDAVVARINGEPVPTDMEGWWYLCSKNGNLEMRLQKDFFSSLKKI